MGRRGTPPVFGGGIGGSWDTDRSAGLGKGSGRGLRWRGAAWRRAGTRERREGLPPVTEKLTGPSGNGSERESRAGRDCCSDTSRMTAKMGSQSCREDRAGGGQAQGWEVRNLQLSGSGLAMVEFPINRKRGCAGFDHRIGNRGPGIAFMTKRLVERVHREMAAVQRGDATPGRVWEIKSDGKGGVLRKQVSWIKYRQAQKAGAMATEPA